MEWVAKDKQEVNEQSAEKIERIMDLLEAHDDVNGVYTNIE